LLEMPVLGFFFRRPLGRHWSPTEDVRDQSEPSRLSAVWQQGRDSRGGGLGDVGAFSLGTLPAWRIRLFSSLPCPSARSCLGGPLPASGTGWSPVRAAAKTNGGRRHGQVTYSVFNVKQLSHCLPGGGR
jgi:hypothetical protein